MNKPWFNCGRVTRYRKRGLKAPFSCVPSTDHLFIMPYPDAFIASVHSRTSSIPSKYYEPEYVQDLKNLPANTSSTLQQEEDYSIAIHKQKGVMFDLLKQLCGFKHKDGMSLEPDCKTQTPVRKKHKGRQYAPAPQYYHYFAYTAYALLNGDLSILNWRPVYSSKGLHGRDVIEAINKFGIYGFTDSLGEGKKIARLQFAALYSRIYNADPRFHTIKTATPKKLHVEKRKSPLVYCPICTVIHKAWDEDKTLYYPDDPEYSQLFSQLHRQIENNKVDKGAVEEQDKYVGKGDLLNVLDVLGDG